jgi:hypothetical protein
MRIACILLSLFLMALAGVPQTAPSPRVRPAPLKNSISSLVDRISGLPPEYKADLGFAIIDANLNAFPSGRKRALIEDIFESAAGARYPYMVLEAAGYEHHDTLSHVTRNLLGRLRLSTLDIQTRAIDRALPSTPQLAKTLFEEMSPPEVRASCKVADVEDVSAFYEIATKIVEDERIRNVFGQDKGSYVLGLATSMRIPAQIGPLGTLINRISLSTVQLNQIGNAFISSLSGITASDREMTAAEEGNGLTSVIGSLSLKLTHAGISSIPLLTAYRDFLVRNLTQEACGDYSLNRAEIAARFNTLLPEKTQPDLTPLSEAELKPQKTGDAAPFQLISFDPQVMKKVQRIRRVHDASVVEESRMHGTTSTEPDAADIEDVVKYAVSAAAKESECPVCDFEAQAHVFSMLVDILPSGNELERVIGAEVNYLSFNPMESDDPVGWLWEFKNLLNISRKPKQAAIRDLLAETKKRPEMVPWGLPNPEAGVIRDMLHGSTDQTIAAYVLADDLLKTSYLTPDQIAQSK